MRSLYKNSHNTIHLEENKKKTGEIIIIDDIPVLVPESFVH